MPEACTRTRTSPGPGWGRSMSSTVSTSAAGPVLRCNAAFMTGLPSWMQRNALEYLVHDIPRAVHRKAGQVQFGRGPDHGAVVVVVAGTEHFHGVDRHWQVPLQRSAVRRRQVRCLSSIYQNGLAY